MGDDKTCPYHGKHEESILVPSEEIISIRAETRIAKWLAAAMFLAALGSLWTVLNVSYNYGRAVEKIDNNSQKINRIYSKFIDSSGKP